jgi:archaellum component FlaC
MVEKDTIRLLRECDAGVKMGVSSIDDVLKYTRDDNFKKRLEECKSEHNKLDKEIQELLSSYNDDGKEPNPVAKGMSWMKTNMKMTMDESDETIADLMTDGCNMGVKSLNKYLNKYKAADEISKDIAKRLINLEEKLSIDIRRYL